MSQKARILKLLEERGERGVHSFEFYEMRMPRGAAAICDLRKEGFVIDGEDEPFRGEAGGKRYFLRTERGRNRLVGTGASWTGAGARSGETSSAGSTLPGRQLPTEEARPAFEPLSLPPEPEPPKLLDHDTPRAA